MGSKDQKYQVIYRGQSVNYYFPGQWTFFQRPRENGGGYWLGRIQPQQYYQPQYQQNYAPPPPPGVPDFGLTLAEQQFLYQNANLIPAFYQTADGKALNKMLVEGLQKMLGGESSGINTIQTANTRNTT